MHPTCKGMGALAGRVHCGHHHSNGSEIVVERVFYSRQSQQWRCHEGDGVKIGSTDNNGIAVAMLVVVMDVQKQQEGCRVEETEVKLVSKGISRISGGGDS
jgi:hypothetical protein